MSNEIKLTISASITNGNLTDSFSPGQISITQTTARIQKGTQSIPTTAAGTAITLGGVTTAGVCYFRNLDANNYIELGVQSGGVFYATVKLKPGETAAFRHAGTPYARANTAAAVLQYGIYED